jgi:HEAT repeat protein
VSKLLLLLVAFAGGAGLMALLVLRSLEQPELDPDWLTEAEEAEMALGRSAWAEGDALGEGAPLEALDAGDSGELDAFASTRGPDGAEGADGGADESGGGRGRRGDGKRGESRAPGAPNPGGRHLATLEEVLATGDPDKLRLFLVSTMTGRGTELGEAEAAVLLRTLGEIDHPGLQGAILMHLERVGGDGITEGLVDFLASKPSRGVVARTFESLSRIRSPAAISALIGAMADPDLGRSRRDAAEALARTRSDLAVAPLAAALGESDRGTRQLAATTLARIGGPDSYRALLDHAMRGDAGDRAYARRLIERSTRGPATVSVFGPSLATSRDPALRITVARTLGRSRDPRAERPLLRSARSDAEPRVRAEAVLALGRLGSRTSAADVEVIAEQDTSTLVRRAAKRALRQLASR